MATQVRSHRRKGKVVRAHRRGKSIVKAYTRAIGLATADSVKLQKAGLKRLKKIRKVLDNKLVRGYNLLPREHRNPAPSYLTSVGKKLTALDNKYL